MAGNVLTKARCDRLHKNLHALRQWLPDIADQLAQTSIPRNTTPATARDGTPTFRFEDDDGGYWFGRTSIPRVRAEALVDTFAPDGGNVLVSPMGSGLEIEYLLKRIPRYCAVFLYEQNIQNVLLTLTLLDFSQFIIGRRLVPLVGADLGDAIERFFESAAGFDVPRRMLAPPYSEAGSLESMRTTMLRSSSRIASMQSDRIEACGRVLEARCSERNALSELIVLSVDPRPSCAETARSIQAAGADMGYPVHVNIPDRPDKCHSLSRMQSLTEVEQAGVLLLNGGWGPLGSHIPAKSPAAVWLLPDVPPLTGAIWSSERDDKHVIFAAPEAIEPAVKAGVDRGRIEVLEVAGDDTNYFPLDVPDNKRFSVACFADVADLAPAASGIELSSHSTLWNSICDEARRNLNATSTEVLDAAERACGVSMEDKSLRGQLIDMIRLRVRPTTLVRSWVEALLDCGVDVRVFGSGWQRSRVPADRVHPRPDTATKNNELYNAARIVICPVMDSDAVQHILNVLMAGGCVVRQGSRSDLQELHPQLYEVLETIPVCSSVGKLGTQVRALLADEAARSVACERARVMVADRHLMRHRLAVIRAKLAETVDAS